METDSLTWDGFGGVSLLFGFYYLDRSNVQIIPSGPEVSICRICTSVLWAPPQTKSIYWVERLGPHTAMLKDHSWHFSGDHAWCQGLSQGQYCAKPVPWTQDCLSGPRTPIFIWNIITFYPRKLWHWKRPIISLHLNLMRQQKSHWGNRVDGFLSLKNNDSERW